MLIVGKVDPGIDDLLITHEMKNTFADHGHAIIDTQNPPLNHG